MELTREYKIKVAEALQELHETVLNGDLALVFEYEQKVNELVGPEVSMGLLKDLSETNKEEGNVVIDVYLSEIFENQGGEQ